ncbi:MAG: PilZ domain-containing protein [Myxococcota bacterium]
MGPESSPNRRILVAHDGELDDVCQLLAGIGGRFLERRGRSGESACDGEWGVVIASPQALLAARFAPDQMPLRIAVVEQGSRTVMAMLKRAGVERIVRRPVHPAALRGLLLHTVYCGPEKRRRQRVNVGAPVRFRTGLWPRRAILSELSIRGCRLLTSHAARRDASITVSLPARLTGKGSLSLRGRVVRTGPASGEDAGTQAVAVVFDDLRRSVLAPLQRLVSEYTRGPATLPGRVPSDRRPRAGAVEPARAAAAEPPAVHADTPPEDAAEDGAAGTDRRTAQRREYERSIIALGEEAARVLIGMDISLGGMRIAPHPDLQVGDSIRIALHVGERMEPLVVGARVDRCDGERGLLLRFEDLDPDASEYLAKLVDGLPELAPNREDDAPAPTSEEAAGDGSEGGEVVVSEILEHASS